MSDKIPSSFSPARRFGIAFNVLARTVLVLVVLALGVHLSQRYYYRAHLSAHARYELSPRTVNFVKTITNQVKVILYFDRDDKLYSMVTSLLTEYQNLNPRIKIQTVDYTRDPAAAVKLKADYQLANSQGKDDKNLIIFDCEGRRVIDNAQALVDRTQEPTGEVTPEGQQIWRVKLVSFRGEQMFTARLLAVTQPKPMKAMFLTNHGEHDYQSMEAFSGYGRFALALQQNFITNAPLDLLGTNTIPPDCNLVVVAGPTRPLSDLELNKLQTYLDEGGRMLILFNPSVRTNHNGLERLLIRHDLIVGDGGVVDAANYEDGNGDVIVHYFSPHIVVNPLVGGSLKMILPRPLNRMEAQNAAAAAPKVDLVAFTGEKAFVAGIPGSKVGRYAVAAVIEKGALPGVATTRGATRILVLGDSTMFANGMIQSWSNLDFAGYAANWLLERQSLLEGVGPRPVEEFRVNMTQERRRMTRWLLLGAVPGAVLALGSLVWLRRRK